MKEKPLAIVITLIGGATACICCIIRKVNLLYTLLIVLICLVVFMILGLVVNRFYSSIKAEVDEKEREERTRREREERRLERERQLAREAEEEERRRLIEQGIDPDSVNTEETQEDDWDSDDDQNSGEEL